MINILTAHHGEARPFIDHYQLKPETIGGTNLYVNRRIHLLITGQGARNVETSLWRLVDSTETPAQQWWINFGLAGSSQFEIASLVLIHQVGAAVSGFSQNINHQKSVQLPVTSCLSVEQPATDYPNHGVIDMEAATIVHILGRINAIDKLMMFKMVSDSPGANSDRITPAMAGQLIKQNSVSICRVCDDIVDACESVSDPRNR